MVAMVLTVTLVMVLDYWWLNLQSLTLVAICNFGRSGISIGEGGLSFGEGGLSIGESGLSIGLASSIHKVTSFQVFSKFIMLK